MRLAAARGLDRAGGEGPLVGIVDIGRVTERLRTWRRAERVIGEIVVGGDRLADDLRAGAGLNRVRVRRGLARRQRDALGAAGLPERESRSDVDRYAALQVRQRE